MPSYKKDNFKESNVNYLNKDFTELKKSLIDYAKSYYPNTYKDFNEASPGMMLLEMSAYVGDVLNFYIDQQYKEMILPLAEERRNVMNLAKMFGYKVKPIIPAHVNLTFTSIVNASTADSSQIDYTDGGVFPEGIVVTSNNDSNLIFETLEPIDFTITGSSGNDTDIINTTNTASGLAETYLLSRTVRAMSAETKTKTFTVDTPEKFLKITLSETNVVDIISCIDANGNNWYEVDYLAQDRVPVPTHYTDDLSNRTNAYYNISGTEPFQSDVPVPYSLEYINSSKRFIRETNEDNTTSLVFGNGILRNGTTLDGEFLDLEQVGVVIPGQAGDLTSAINPLLGNEYSTLGETPNQTTLTIKYRIGGGVNSNAAVDDLNQFTAPVTLLANNASSDAEIFSVTNNIPARGGKDEESVEEIREKTKAFFSTQNRCVTKEDYEARVMNIPAKYGNIAKVYVSRDFEENTNTLINLVDIRLNLERLVSEIDTGTEPMFITPDQIDALQAYIGAIPTNNINLTSGAGAVQIFILSYDKNKNLVGNPAAGTTALPSEDSVQIPSILKNNIKSYINEFRILTDSVNILDGFIINFGVFFDVVTHKYANNAEVKLLCIEKIKEYFNIDKMQFSQPIYVSQLEYELMGIDGVRAVNYVTITQYNDWNVSDGTGENLAANTYKYSVTSAGDFIFDDSGDAIVDNAGTAGYGWLYNFEAAYENGVILPPDPATPAVFELKNPNQNIRGVVR
jgi:hypothetical protein